jgi:hypothetical protein
MVAARGSSGDRGHGGVQARFKFAMATQPDSEAAMMATRSPFKFKLALRVWLCTALEFPVAACPGNLPVCGCWLAGVGRVVEMMHGHRAMWGHHG